MHVGVNSLSVEPGRVGGGETYLVNLVREMIRHLGRGERITVIATRANAPLFAGTGAAVSAWPIPHRPAALRLAFEHFALPFLLPGLGIDVLLSPGNALPPLAGVRHVLALQSMHYRFIPHEMSRFRVAYFRRMVPTSAGRAARIACMSEDLRRTLLEVSPRAARKSLVVYEGADLSRLTPDGPAEPGEYLLYVSSLNPFKRPDRIVEALAHLRRTGFEPPVCRFVGRPDPPDRERVERRAAELEVADLVRIEGARPHDSLAPLYRGARALVYPSTLETFGLPPLEAMACGTPVVASNRTSVPEVVGDAALTVEPDDVPALAGAIRRVLEDQETGAELVRRGFANVKRFSWTDAARATLSELRAAAKR